MAIVDDRVEQAVEEASLKGKPVHRAVPARQMRWWRPRVWCQWLHRWATLALGLLLMVITTSGAIALYDHDLSRLSNLKYYQETPSERRITLDEAHAIVAEAVANDASLPNVIVGDVVDLPDGGYMVFIYGEEDEYYGDAFVDPGTGEYLGYYKPEETVWGWITTLHVSLFADEVLIRFPEGTPEWLTTAIGLNLGEFTLKYLGLMLLIMVLTGAYIWWPGVRNWLQGFRIRKGGSWYVWHYDWHKVLGFVSLPFLFMWAVTGTAFLHLG